MGLRPTQGDEKGVCSLLLSHHSQWKGPPPLCPGGTAQRSGGICSSLNQQLRQTVKAAPLHRDGLKRHSGWGSLGHNSG